MAFMELLKTISSWFNLWWTSNQSIDQEVANTEFLPEFRYSNLLTGEIRILHILPGQSNQQIQCRLDHVKLQDQPQYTALSYAWGDTTREQQKITIRDYETRDSILQVGENLHCALLALRSPDKEHTFWIDAICIDQKNDVEKTIQLLLMKDIYSRAAKVLIWLGSAADDSDYVMEFLAQRTVPGDERFMTAFTKILQRSWFRRTWVIQEFSLNPSPPLIKCGFVDPISWEVFEEMCVRFPLFLKQIGEALRASMSLHDEFELMNSLSHLESQYRAEHLHYLCKNRDSYQAPESILSEEPLIRHISLKIVWGKEFEVSNPVDRVYGHVGLMTESQVQTLQVDYSKSVRQVYQDAVWTSIVQDKTPFLYFNYLCPLAVGQNPHNLASWVPDLSDNVARRSLEGSSLQRWLVLELGEKLQNGDSPQLLAELQEDDLLSCKGLICDEVELIIGSTIHSNFEWDSLWRELHDDALRIRRHGINYMKETIQRRCSDVRTVDPLLGMDWDYYDNPDVIMRDHMKRVDEVIIENHDELKATHRKAVIDVLEEVEEKFQSHEPALTRLKKHVNKQDLYPFSTLYMWSDLLQHTYEIDEKVLAGNLRRLLILNNTQTKPPKPAIIERNRPSEGRVLEIGDYGMLTHSEPTYELGPTPLSYFMSDKDDDSTTKLTAPFRQALPKGQFFFITKRGYWGVACAGIKKGDRLSLLFGEWKFPMIIRPEGKHYYMVGPALLDKDTRNDAYHEYHSANDGLEDIVFS
jgi:hypothetical protein